VNRARWKNVLFIMVEWAAFVTLLQPEIIFLVLEKADGGCFLELNLFDC
jgi:hypothetical protein